MSGCGYVWMWLCLDGVNLCLDVVMFGWGYVRMRLCLDVVMFGWGYVWMWLYLDGVYHGHGGITSEWSPGHWLPILSPHVNSFFNVIYSKRNSTNSPTELGTHLTMILFIDKSTLVVQHSYVSTDTRVNHTFLFPATRLHQGSATDSCHSWLYGLFMWSLMYTYEVYDDT